MTSCTTSLGPVKASAGPRNHSARGPGPHGPSWSRPHLSKRTKGADQPGHTDLSEEPANRLTARRQADCVQSNRLSILFLRLAAEHLEAVEAARPHEVALFASAAALQAALRGHDIPFPPCVAGRSPPP